MSAMERVTVTLPAELVEKIDQLERNRSRFIAEAVEHELAQRRELSRRLLKLSGGSVDDYATFSTSVTSPSC